MNFDISSLTASELFWDTTGVWLAAGVLIGVSLEAVTTFDKLADWLRLNTLERHGGLRQTISKAGFLILVAALALEVVAAIRSHAISQQIIAGLNGEILGTQQREEGLIKLTNGLNRQLRVQGITLDSLGEQNTAFEKAANEQRRRNNKVLAVLRRDESSLETAKLNATESAGIAAKAADSARKAATEMTSTLNAERAMQQQLHNLVTPRQIDDAHFAELVKALKPFAGTEIEVGVNRDNESIALLIRITDALTQANWVIKRWSGAGFSLTDSARLALRAIGDVTTRGIQISMSESDRGNLGAAARALGNGLFNAGLNVVPLRSIPDKTADGKANPSRIRHGVIRLVVGAK